MIYNLVIYFDSGSPSFYESEYRNVENAKEVSVDYLCLLLFNRLSLLTTMLDAFDKIHVPQTLFDEIQFDILKTNSPEIRTVWNVVRNHPKVVFNPPNTVYDNVSSSILAALDDYIADGFVLARDLKVPFIVGDERWKRVCEAYGCTVTGVSATLNYLYSKGIIDQQQVTSAKLVFIKENVTFVSFNVADIILLARENNYLISKDIEQFVDVMIKRIPGSIPEIDTFIKVYLGVLVSLFKLGVVYDNIKPWFAKYLNIFQKIFMRSKATMECDLLFDDPTVQRIAKVNFNLSLFAIESVLAITDILIEDENKKACFLSFISQCITSVELIPIYKGRLIANAKKRAANMRNELDAKTFR